MKKGFHFAVLALSVYTASSAADSAKLTVVELRPKVILPVTQQVGTHGTLQECEFMVESRQDLTSHPRWSDIIVSIIIHTGNSKDLISDLNPFFAIGAVDIPSLPLPDHWSTTHRQYSWDMNYTEKSYEGGVLKIVSNEFGHQNIYRVMADPDLRYIQEVSYTAYKRDDSNQLIEKSHVECAPLTN